MHMTIMTEFILYADDFPVDNVIKTIGISEYECVKKGDVIYYGENKALQRIEDCSSITYSTDYIETDDLKKPIEIIVKMLSCVSKKIIECIQTYGLTAKFCVVINLTDNPIIELSKEFINIAASFNASIEFDSYVNYDNWGNLIMKKSGDEESGGNTGDSSLISR